MHVWYRSLKAPLLELFVALVTLQLSGCGKFASPRGQAALNLQIVAHQQAPVSKVKILLVPEQGEALGSEVALTGEAGVKRPSHLVHSATILVRGQPGLYAVKVQAFDKRGLRQPQCTAVLSGAQPLLRASQGRLKKVMIAIECAGVQSPLPEINHPPQNLRVHFPPGNEEQQGSFSQTGTANLCLRAWDPDQHPLRFELQDLSHSSCQIHPQAVSKNSTQERCYTVRCDTSFVGRLQLQARVLDQVWRNGSRVDVQACPAPGDQESCQGPASSKSLHFSLKFVQPTRRPKVRVQAR